MPDTASSLPGNRVLLVEDNEINQEIACELLRDLGLTPCVVENGQEAVDAVQQESFALIFMDIQMPVMDGLEATRQIRACTHACAHDVPIIAMTAHALQDDREQSFAVGMNAHLTKPIDPGMLQRIVARWLPGTCSRMAVGTGADADQTPAPDTPLSPDAHTAPPHPDADGTAVALGLHSLYGVNVIAGVANVVGNEKLYIDLLRRFAAKYCDSHRELISLISQQDIEGAARLAHTIKGVAANLGAGALADMVKKIETGILSGEDVLNEIEPYRIELEHVTASIDALIQSTQSDTKAAEAHTLDPDTKSRIRAELVALPDLMQTDWGQAQERLDAVAEILDGTPAEPACTRLRNALEEFDVIAFTQAVEAVCAHL